MFVRAWLRVGLYGLSTQAAGGASQPGNLSHGLVVDGPGLRQWHFKIVFGASFTLNKHIKEVELSGLEVAALRRFVL